MKKAGWCALLLTVGLLVACGDTTEENGMEEMPEEEIVEETGGMDMNEEEATEEESEDIASDAPMAESGVASELLAKGEMTSFLFTETGEFNVFCEPHPVMKMTVIVEEGAELSGEVAVDIADYEFVEPTLTVAPGTVITWTNQDNVRHNVAFQ